MATATPSARRGLDGGEAARRVAQAGRATKARLVSLAVTHRYNRTHCLWPEQFQIADYFRFLSCQSMGHTGAQIICSVWRERETPAGLGGARTIWNVKWAIRSSQGVTAGLPGRQAGLRAGAREHDAGAWFSSRLRSSARLRRGHRGAGRSPWARHRPSGRDRPRVT